MDNFAPHPPVAVLYNADEGQAAKKGSTGELYTLSANRDNVNPQSLLPTPEVC